MPDGRRHAPHLVRRTFWALESGLAKGTLPVGADLIRRTPPIALSGAFSAFSASVRNGWPRRWGSGGTRTRLAARKNLPRWGSPQPRGTDGASALKCQAFGGEGANLIFCIHPSSFILPGTAGVFVSQRVILLSAFFLLHSTGVLGAGPVRARSLLLGFSMPYSTRSQSSYVRWVCCWRGADSPFGVLLLPFQPMLPVTGPLLAVHHG